MDLLVFLLLLIRHQNTVIDMDNSQDWIRSALSHPSSDPAKFTHGNKNSSRGFLGSKFHLFGSHGPPPFGSSLSCGYGVLSRSDEQVDNKH
jgi:hypothetical protein